MIAYIKGNYTQKTHSFVVIETSGGVAYHINISLHTYGKIQELNAGKLFTHLHVKEDAQTLYGFFTEDERSLFQHLISVSGVGPASAQMFLSAYNPADIQQAIVNEDINLLKSVKGIGPKTAKRLVLELKDKLAKLTTTSEIISTSAGVNNQIREDALAALINLGIGKPIAQRAINRVLKDKTQNVTTVEVLIRQALNAM